jgi:hypothetical protein
MHVMLGLRRGLLAGAVAVTVGGCFLWSSVAGAAVGVVTKLEAEAHSAPFDVAPIVYRLQLGNKVSADDQAKDGWRRVRLSDGTFAFVRDAELQIEPSPPAGAPPAGAPTAPPLRATVKVLELTARAAPSADAPVLQVLPQGTVLAVSSVVTNGWREAHLADGRPVYLADAGLEMIATAAGAADSAPLASPVVSLLRPASSAISPKIYVKDLDHLAQLVKADSVVSPMAEELLAKRNTAVGVGVASLGVGLLLLVLSVTALKRSSCVNNMTDFCTSQPNEAAFVGGLGVAVVGTMVGLLVAPRRGAFLDLVNNWNARHLDNQFTIEAHEIGVGGFN